MIIYQLIVFKQQLFYSYHLILSWRIYACCYLYLSFQYTIIKIFQYFSTLFQFLCFLITVFDTFGIVVHIFLTILQIWSFTYLHNIDFQIYMTQSNQINLNNQEQLLIIQAKIHSINQNSNQEHFQYLAQILKQKFKIAKTKQQLNNILKEKNQKTKPNLGKKSLFQQFAQKQISHKKTYICKSKRKIKPIEINVKKTLEQKIQNYDSTTSQCFLSIEKRKKSGLSLTSSSSLNQNFQWIYNENFYSSVDRSFFKEDKMFKKILIEANIKYQNLSYQQFKFIKKSFPKSKLFDYNFINDITQKLQQFRNQYRITSKQRGRQFQLNVGKQVNALHPICGHIHPGSILAVYKQNYYMVKFQQFILGTQRVHDTCITTKQSNNALKIVVQNIDFQIMALAIKLLQFKADLIKKFKQYNIIAQQAKNQKQTLNADFYQRYGWIGSTINILNIGVKHVISKFRLRGLPTTNQQKIGKNFASIVVNPLTLMREQLRKSDDMNDKQACKQINSIIKGHKQNQAQKFTNELYNKNYEGIKNIKNEDTKLQIETLLKRIIYVIINLKCQNKSFSPHDDKKFNQLIKFLYQKYPEASNQVYDTIINICSKTNDDK